MNAKDRDVSTEAGTALDTEGPLRRWARRRREVAREEQAAAEAWRRKASQRSPPRESPSRESSLQESSPRKPSHELPEARDSHGGAYGPAVEAEKVPTDEDMPPLDSLDQNSDYSGFLSPGVTEGLRRRALRKLFLSAAFNVPDGLDDYDDDFTSFQALGDIVTSDMKHQAEMEAERAKQARAEAEPASELRDESGEDEGARLAQADGEAADTAEEGPAGTAAPAGPPAVTGAGSPEDVADEDGAGRGGRREQARSATEPASDGVAARSPANEPAAGSEEASRVPRPADGRTRNRRVGESASAGADAPGSTGKPGPGRA